MSESCVPRSWMSGILQTGIGIKYIIMNMEDGGDSKENGHEEDLMARKIASFHDRRSIRQSMLK